MSKLNAIRKRARGQPATRMPGGGPGLLVAGGLVLLAVAGFLIWRGQGAGGNADFKPQVTGAARLTVDQEQVDLGDVKLGQTVQVSFQLANVGDQPLRFTEAPYIEVVAGC